jgi:dTDP-4-dehydrorhamnose 3,5-epimerase-like enzyme
MKIDLNNTPIYTDKRGSIAMVLESCSIGSISRIQSFPETWRARHWHPNDFHFCEVIYGEMQYYHVPMTNGTINGKPELFVVSLGELIYTPPGYFHEMVFEQHTIFNCYSHLPRVQSNYEAETKRLDISLKELYNK